MASTQVSPGLGEAGVVLAAYAVAQTSGQTVQTSAQTGGKVTWLDIEAAQQEVASAKQQVAAAETQVESAKLALEQAKENAAKREVTAPISGVITALNIENGDTIGGSTGSAAGASSAAASTSTNSGTSSGSTGVMVITNLESFQVSVSLSETDISAVEVGQKATISFDALPDLTLTGKVTRVDTI
ncbi:MAG: HlyD family efflux transporter periplasmic adaptor subunit, partial [Thermoleophilia bacterium]|nr:HlyD family efflux transporter periplasmic adaptor subunit [Thermoleophilia bacterium]